MKIPSTAKNIPTSALAVITFCTVAFAAMIFTDDLGALTATSVLKRKAGDTVAGGAATNGAVIANYNSSAAMVSSEEGERAEAPTDTNGVVDEENMAFLSAKDCSATEGEWVFDSSVEPLYSDKSCPYLDRQVRCMRNGRPDLNYLRWVWQMDGCTLPRFNAPLVLEKLRNKRLIFVGDSMQRAQWQSFVCMVQAHIPANHKSMTRSRSLNVFRAKEYNATIEFYWSPFLVESNSDVPVLPEAAKRIVRIDSIAKHAQHWVGADVLVFGTYVWWMNGPTIKSRWGSAANGVQGFEELDVVTAYSLSLATWANFVDSTINPNSTKVFFTTMTPAHVKSSDWGNDRGIMCYNETAPVTARGYWGSASDPRMMQAVREAVERMRVPVTVLNVTQLSEYRIDGHVSVYTDIQGQPLSDAQKADPIHYADCIHWCLPGVPDTWNYLFYAYL